MSHVNMCFCSAYHGHLNTMIDISPYKFKLPGGTPQRDWVHVVSHFYHYFALDYNKLEQSN